MNIEPPASSSLSSILSLASSLHENGSLSLQQLVPVHFSLIQSSQGAPQQDTANIITSLDDSEIHELLNRENEAQQLLFLQYQMVSSTNSPLQAFSTTVLPFLLSPEAGVVSEDLREALLDAVFSTTTKTSSSSSEEEEEEREWLEACFQVCQQQQQQQQEQKQSPQYWTNMCRLLVRLYRYLDDDNNTNPALQQHVVDFMYTVVLQGIQVALTLSSDKDLMKVLHPIVTWLLPLLFQESSDNIISARVNELWTCLFTNLDNGIPTNQQTALVISVVLCSILPSLLDIELPVVGSTSQDDTTTTSMQALPVQQESLWNFIYYSLQQGMESTSLAQTVSLDQMLRRRGIHLLRILLVEGSLQNANNSKQSTWLKYVLCFEALEMETEPHLVNQVWDTVAELCLAAAASSEGQSQQQQLDDKNDLPNMTWEYISAMLARVFLSDTPILRKLGLYRFLSGRVGISISINDAATTTTTTSVEEMETTIPPSNNNNNKKKKQGKKSKQKKKSKTPPPTAPITLVSSDFVMKIVLPSYDSLVQSVGTNWMFEENGKVQVHDVTPLLESFLGIYVSSLDMERRREFLAGLFSQSVVCDLRLKTTVLVYEAVASAAVDLPINQELMKVAVQSFGVLFTATSIVAAYRERLITAFATMLSNSCSTDEVVNPQVLLKVLALYPIPEIPQSTDSENIDASFNLLNDDPKFAALQTWLEKLGTSPSWTASTVGATCASAFVMEQLFPTTSEWSPESGCSEVERTMGAAIVLLCALAAASEKSNASELLWPAIHKGLASVPQGKPWHNANRTSRALILLENGCRLHLTSGVGNGDLVMNKNQQMMPPSPSIELLLSNAVGFDLTQIEALTSFEGVPASSKSVGARSGAASRVSATLASLINQMKVFCNSYPSSIVVFNAADTMLESSMKKLANKDLTAIGVVQNTALSFGSLSCGAEVKGGGASIVESCRLMLHLSFPGNKDGSISNVQTARSVFQYSKWGALSFLLSSLLGDKDASSGLDNEHLSFLTDLFDEAEDAVYASPADALLPLFDCVVTGARSWLSPASKNQDENGCVNLYEKNLKKVISALFNLLGEAVSGRPVVYMLNEICALLFRPELLMDEYQRTVREGDDSPTPIRDAFRRLMEMSGTTRPHISKIATSYISAAWLGNEKENKEVSGRASLGAIPYRTDICQLLLHKEIKLEQSSAIQETDIIAGPNDLLPSGTDDASITRGFVLLFLSLLPYVKDGLPNETLTNLLHFTISYLLDDVCLVDITGTSLLVIGTVEYSKKMRAWQSLCVLSRFVTVDIAGEVCDKVFECMRQSLHGQIRYFLEAFAIQCARLHPGIFGPKLVKEIRRENMTLQNVSSLMIITGNLLVGRYQEEFISAIEIEGENALVDLKEILAGVIPWLSSTQGFSRAISQLLVHKLVPMVIDITDSSKRTGLDDSDWFLASIYRFLDENAEMKRLRKKQAKFFERYDVDDICSAETILEMKVDEGSEASPSHLVEAMKKCLDEVYAEAHQHESPEWKDVAEMMLQTSLEEELDDSPEMENDQLVNFQRKIIPLDSLELDLGASRTARLKNARGCKKQSLIVVASLVDKIPNLGGLARTSEIFAAERLVIPDMSVCRMDNFKSISVSAGEWIDIEECKENELLGWLRKEKERGYTVVGLEQTSSSMPLSDYSFAERTVLLLGKEKEGIPVEFLQVVDVCLEIPQLGVIRSLNVHVTGALAIWEYTKQMMER